MQIIAKDITKSFTKHEKKGVKLEFNALDNVNFEVNSGEIVGVLGPNGAGKTTLLRTLGALITPDKGEAFLRDGDIEYKNALDIKRNIGYLSNNTRLYGRFSPRELLFIMGELYGMEKEVIEKRSEEIKKMLRMEDFFENRVENLSTGQTQKTSIARTLIHDPSVYIMDEPTLGLDILSTGTIIDFMKKQKELGKTVIYSTHYMEEAEVLCDRIILINKGKIVASGTLLELQELTGKTGLREVFFSLVNEEVQ